VLGTRAVVPSAATDREEHADRRQYDDESPEQPFALTVRQIHP
jgi:hypothetical protein